MAGLALTVQTTLVFNVGNLLAFLSSLPVLRLQAHPTPPHLASNLKHFILELQASYKAVCLYKLCSYIFGHVKGMLIVCL